jgi:toxin ParE1/3/4
MLRVEKSYSSDLDIENIWHYSFEQWGEAQADRYYDSLSESITRLAHSPKIGLSRDHIRPGLRAHHVGRHLVYYYIRDDHIYIVRIKHDRSDPYLYEE